MSSWRVKVLITRNTRSGSSYVSSGQRSAAAAAGGVMGQSLRSPIVEKPRVRERWEELDDLEYQHGGDARGGERAEVRQVWPQSRLARMEQEQAAKGVKRGYNNVSSFQR